MLEKTVAAASAGFLATAAQMPDAHAFDQASGDVGAYLAYTFGGPNDADAGFGWGLQARAYLKDWYHFCEDGPSPYVGGTARFGFMGWSRPRLVVAAQGGALIGQFFSGSGELGLGYRWGEGAGMETILGVELGALFGNLRAIVDPSRGEIGLGLGFRAPGFAFDGCAIAGRPLREADGVADAPSVLIDGETERAVANWCQRTRTEWASVPAFFELAEQLAAVGAPSHLIDRAYEAAADEIRHAVISGGVASALGGGTIVVDRTRHDQRAPAAGRHALLRLAVESWIDGVLGEGVAARVAHCESQLVEAPERIRSVQRSIAVDEAKHADLAWDVLRWTLAMDREAVRDGLAAARDAEPIAESAPPADDELFVFGAIDAATTDRLKAMHFCHARERLDLLISG